MRRDHEPLSYLECAGLVPGVRRSECSLAALPRLESELGRALQERAGRGVPAARPDPIRQPIQVSGDARIRPEHRQGAVPGLPFGVEQRIGGVGERAVDDAPCLRRRGPVHRGAHERMVEDHPVANHHEPRFLRGGQRLRPDSQQPGRAPQQ